MVRFLLVFALASGSIACADETQQPPAQPDKSPPTTAEMEKSFARAMSGVEMAGYYTTAGEETKNPLKEDRYTIQKVAKLDGDYWLFLARIRYGDRDLTIPLRLQVKWAGDTPVITLTDVPVPPLGTFSARVLIYRNQYAGTWSAADHGGHLFGAIKRTGETREQPAAPLKTDP